MLSLNEQLQEQSLVCPRTYLPLRRVNNYLETVDGQNKYNLLGDIPVLFADIEKQHEYLRENHGKMNEEYVSANPNLIKRLKRDILGKAYKNKSAITAFNSIFYNLPAHALCIAIGGGPTRHHEKLINVNIGIFENVDVVADAYKLPYADKSVDIVYIEAVLEHLEFPDVAVREMYRVLKEGGKVYTDTPFMQAFHGYPNHFQNFTIEGHKRLFTRNGFTIKEIGTSVGPSYALFSFLTQYITNYSYSPIIKYPFLLIANMLSVLLKPIDLSLNKNYKSHILASSTFIYAIK